MSYNINNYAQESIAVTGKKFVDLIIMGVLVLITVVTAGIFGFTEFMYQRPLVDESAEKLSLDQNLKNNMPKEGLKIEKIAVNIKSETARLRFLELAMHIIPFSAKHKEILEKASPMIYDRIGQVAAKMTPEDLNSISGKILFEDRLKRKINEDFNDQIVREIYFTSFVVQ
ncbi:MAG: flagellar basal body-associated FliL family protein [Bdellovibrio sp.]|nr:flagellar basal body-associated FliL family protein [Bdellovibrio sp.]